MAKKDFKADNPALNFISIPEEELEPVKEEPEVKPAPAHKDLRRPQPPEGYKVNPAFIELKSRRVQLLLQPSVVEAVKELAKAKGLSMNEIFSEAVIEYLERNKD